MSQLRYLGALGRADEAFERFAEMRRHGSDMDVFTTSPSPAC
jgi:pentatricopeptide repeat protein